MIKKLTWFSAGIICTLLLMLSARVVVGSAADGWQNIDVYYGDISITVDGKGLDTRDANGNIVKLFIYEGTTYVPLRAVAQACAKQVEWDERNKSIYIGALPQLAIDDIQYERLPDGRISIIRSPGITSVEEVAEGELWEKMGVQIFNIWQFSWGNMFAVFADDTLQAFPNMFYPSYSPDAYFSYKIADLDQDGEYEFYYTVFHGSGLPHPYLHCYSPKYDISTEFGTMSNIFFFAQTDDEHLTVRLAGGEEIPLEMVLHDGRRYVEPLLSADLPEKIKEEIEHIKSYRLERGI